jgi:hypothetical protein
MNNVHEYHRNAAECFCLAQETSSTETKELLLYMAEEWRKLADKAGVRSLEGTRNTPFRQFRTVNQGAFRLANVM